MEEYFTGDENFDFLIREVNLKICFLTLVYMTPGKNSNKMKNTIIIKIKIKINKFIFFLLTK